MILVIGATGSTGRHVVAGLTARGAAVRCLVRQAPASAAARAGSDRGALEHAIGDAADPERVARAMRGVERVFLAMSNGPAQRGIELGVVAAAARAGARQIVKVSAPVVGPDVPVAIARMHYEIERAIEATPLSYTHLRPYAFMQNVLAHASTIVPWRVMFGMTGDTPMNFVDARDVAAVAVAALMDPDPGRAAHVLTGPEALSLPEVARRLTAVLGEPVTYVHQTVAELARGYARAGLPPWLVAHLIEIQQLTLAHEERTTDAVARLTGSAPRTIDAFLAEHAAHLRGARSWADRSLGWLMARRSARSAAR